MLQRKKDHIHHRLVLYPILEMQFVLFKLLHIIMKREYYTLEKLTYFSLRVMFAHM